MSSNRTARRPVSLNRPDMVPSFAQLRELAMVCCVTKGTLWHPAQELASGADMRLKFPGKASIAKGEPPLRARLPENRLSSEFGPLLLVAYDVEGGAVGVGASGST